MSLGKRTTELRGQALAPSPSPNTHSFLELSVPFLDFQLPLFNLLSMFTLLFSLSLSACS